MSDDDNDDNKIMGFPNAAERLLQKLEKDLGPVSASVAASLEAVYAGMVSLIGFPKPPDQRVISALMVTSRTDQKPTIQYIHDATVIAQLYEFVGMVIKASETDWQPCLARLNALIAEHTSLQNHFAEYDDRFVATVEDLHRFYAVPEAAWPLMEDALTVSLSREPIAARRNEWVRGALYVALLSAIRDIASKNERGE